MEELKRLLHAMFMVHLSYWVPVILATLMKATDPRIAGALSVATWILWKVECRGEDQKR